MTDNSKSAGVEFCNVAGAVYNGSNCVAAPKNCADDAGDFPTAWCPSPVDDTSHTHRENTLTYFFRLLFSEHNGMIYNVGNDEEVSVKEVAETIQKIMGKSINIRIVESNDPDYTKDNPQRRCPDLSLIKDSVKYIPKINLEDGLKRIYKWYMRE